MALIAAVEVGSAKPFRLARFLSVSISNPDSESRTTISQQNPGVITKFYSPPIIKPLTEPGSIQCFTPGLDEISELNKGEDPVTSPPTIHSKGWSCISVK